MQPQWQKINSVAPIKKIKTRRDVQKHNNIKARSNSSNLLNKAEEELENDIKKEISENQQNYHSAQRSTQNSRVGEVTVYPNAIWMSVNDKHSNDTNGTWKLGRHMIHLLPSTPNVFRNVKRLEFSRRMEMMEKPIIIINFWGIIGNFSKEQLFSDNKVKFVIRGGSASALQMFCSYFQVILFLHSDSKKYTSKIREWLKSHNIMVDAIYRRKSQDNSYEQWYTQIFKDFNITSPKSISMRVLVISSLDLDGNTINNDTELKTILSKEGRKLVRGLYFTLNSKLESSDLTAPLDINIPKKSAMDMPLTLLFPNVLSDYGEELSMFSIFKIVMTIALLSLKDGSANSKNSKLLSLREADIKIQRKYLGIDFSFSWSSPQAIDNYFVDGTNDEQSFKDAVIEAENHKFAKPSMNMSESMNNSFEMNRTTKICSSDEETSDHDSWSSCSNIPHNKLVNQALRLPKQQAKNSTLNEASLAKVNWLIGYEEISSKRHFSWLSLNTSILATQAIKYSQNIIKWFEEKQQRDEKLQEMLDAEINDEGFYKSKWVQMTSLVSNILKSSGAVWNPLQSMAARNIRHFENVRKEILDPIRNRKEDAKKQEQFEKEKEIVNDHKQFLNEIHKYKAIKNKILAFGFTEKNKDIFWRVDREKEDVILEEEFNLLKWFFSRAK